MIQKGTFRLSASANKISLSNLNEIHVLSVPDFLTDFPVAYSFLWNTKPRIKPHSWCFPPCHMDVNISL